MKTRKGLMKENRINEILSITSERFKSDSNCYKTVERGLNKLNLDEVKSLYIMIGSTVDP
ncbi:hypothetical protein COB55_03425 [Candidatus Wolfebacteria bacterium]|nr:MAG: hypothetical protein COB55_03425 [Candidatus Wolfebacteria bacterium]